MPSQCSDLHWLKKAQSEDPSYKSKWTECQSNESIHLPFLLPWPSSIQLFSSHHYLSLHPLFLASSNASLSDSSVGPWNKLFTFATFLHDVSNSSVQFQEKRQRAGRKKKKWQDFKNLSASGLGWYFWFM